MDTKRVTKNFLWSELLVSSSFPELAAKIILDEKDKYNYYHLISTTLQPQREFSSIQTKIVQGKRSLELYQAIKNVGFNPSASSQHFCRNPFDCAIDFQKIRLYDDGKININMSRIATYEAFLWIKKHCRFGFGQMYHTAPIIESEQIGFVHIGSVTPARQGETWTK